VGIWLCVCKCDLTYLWLPGSSWVFLATFVCS
jgi:hypothetical protein